MAAILISVVFASLLCSLVPAILFITNLRRYREPPGDGNDGEVSVLIPARDEEQNIAACVESVLSNDASVLEVLVLDDASTDQTATIVRDLAKRDRRVQLLQSSLLPEGWNGKQHACWLLAQAAKAPMLLFLDADVRLSPTALQSCIGELRRSRIALVSGFPQIMMESWMEKLLLPLIHFVLLSFLPMGRMRKTTKTAYSAGCGQFLLVDRDAYFDSGGHAAIRTTRHDGLRLPEALRAHGYHTDICDLASLARVRMYDSAQAVWQGLAKNAAEGMAAPARIVPFTVMLILGQIVPVCALVLLFTGFVRNTLIGARLDQPALTMTLTAAILLAAVASFLPRMLAAKRFAQPILSALLHPLGVALLLCVQWYALVRQVAGNPVPWRSRSS